MKNTNLCAIIISLLTVLVCGTGFAAEDAVSVDKVFSKTGSSRLGKDWGVMMGMKVWANEWDLPIEYPLNPSESNILAFESPTTITTIPAIMLRYRNFFVGGSYLGSTEYQFQAQETPFDGTHVRFDPSGKRTEWDVNMGYFITPNLALGLGYKKLKRDLTLNISFRENNYADPISMEYPLSVNVPFIGFAAALPVGRNFNFYGNMAFGLLSGEGAYVPITDGEFDTIPLNFDLDGNYTLAELGFNYVIPTRKIVSSLAVNAGYRFQRLDMRAGGLYPMGDAGDQHDATAGFFLGVNCAF